MFFLFLSYEQALIAVAVQKRFNKFGLPKILELKIEGKRASQLWLKNEQDSTTTLVGPEDCKARDTQLDNESSFKIASQNMIIQHISSQ